MYFNLLVWLSSTKTWSQTMERDRKRFDSLCHTWTFASSVTSCSHHCFFNGEENNSWSHIERLSDFARFASHTVGRQDRRWGSLWLPLLEEIIILLMLWETALARLWPKLKQLKYQHHKIHKLQFEQMKEMTSRMLTRDTGGWILLPLCVSG